MHTSKHLHVHGYVGACMGCMLALVLTAVANYFYSVTIGGIANSRCLASYSTLYSRMSKEKAQPIKTIVRDERKQVKEWKSKLTAALDDTALLISLILLGCFYLAYTGTNYFLGGNTRDQDTITSGCSCRFTARVLYRLWFTVFLIIWIFVYSYVPLERTFQGFIYCVPKCREAWDLVKCGNRMEAVRKFCSKVCSRCCCNSGYFKTQAASKTADDDHESASRSAYNEKILWYQYYTLYNMGYTATTEIKPSQPSQQPDRNQRPDHVHDKDHDDKRPNQSTAVVSNCFSSLSSCQNIICSITIRNFIRAILLFIKYFSQLVTVPRGVRNAAKLCTRLRNLYNFTKITPGLCQDYTEITPGLYG